jgi:hypothetical protein
MPWDSMTMIVLEQLFKEYPSGAFAITILDLLSKWKSHLQLILGILAFKEIISYHVKH